MPKEVGAQNDLVGKLIGAYSREHKNHQYVSSGKDSSGRKWTVKSSRDATATSTTKIFSLLRKELKKGTIEEYDGELLSAIVDKMKDSIKAKEDNIKGWKCGRAFLVRFLNCIRGRGFATSSERAAKLSKDLHIFSKKIYYTEVNKNFTDQELIDYCKQNPNIQALDLTGCANITDKGLAALQHLKGSLVKLRLSDNKQITSAGLKNLEGFTALRDLSLKGLSRVQKLPDLSESTALQSLYVTNLALLKSASGLSQCSALKDLQFSKIPKLENPPDLSKCIALERLRFEEMGCLQKLPDLHACVALKGLFLDQLPQVRELPSLSNCTALEKLHASQLKVKTFPNLNKCTDLEQIWLSSLDYLKGPLELSKCTALKDISLTQLVCLKGLSDLSSCTALEKLDLFKVNNCPSNLDLSKCVALRNLSLVKIPGSGKTH